MKIYKNSINSIKNNSRETKNRVLLTKKSVLPHTRKASFLSFSSILRGFFMAKEIKTILNSLLAQHNNWQLQLLQCWPSIVGNIKTDVQLLKIYEDTLVIGVMDSCWLQELYLLSPLLIQTINQKLDLPRIKKLRFKSIGITDKKIKKESRKKVTEEKTIQLNAQEKEILVQIKDKQLATFLHDYLIRVYRENT